MSDKKRVIRVVMRIPKQQEWEFRGRHSVAKILRKLEMNPESVIVIHGESLLTPGVSYCLARLKARFSRHSRGDD